jgi:hypothetical protein
MRSLALIALGSLVAAASLTGQSLADHAAAAAGATVGTAGGKPIGTALGKIFGDVDKSTSKAAGPKVIVTTKPPALAPPHSAPPAASGGSSAAAGAFGSSGRGRSASASARQSAQRREPPAADESRGSAQIDQALNIPAPITPVVKEPSLEEVAAVKVGATSNELEATLGAPESRVSIPGDDGHLLEICQYWAKGQPLGTVRLDNGLVVSVQTQPY